MDLKFFTCIFIVCQYCFGDVESLQCYACTQVDDPRTCNATLVCGVNEACYVQSSLTSSSPRFSMGCQDKLKCRNTTHSATPIIGRSLNIKRQVTEPCHECCSVDGCNKDLCSHKMPTACEDDPSFDCARISSLFDVCKNTQNAKNVCPKFCDLCDYADGKWTEWNAWNACDVTCANGTQTRSRSCTNPAPAHGGHNCTGESTQHKTCTEKQCPVDGNWAVWSKWSDCDVSCANGVRSRARSCTNPAPANGGNICQGANIQRMSCTKSPCPVDGSWTLWSNWSRCDVTCANGTRTRTRTCTNPSPAYGGRNCPQDGRQYLNCLNNPCPVHGGWSTWSKWGHCSATCDMGLSRRDRACTNPRPSLYGDNCYGDAHEDRICLASPCTNGVWLPWGSWGACPVTCAGGIRRRHRACDNPTPSVFGSTCIGNDEEADICNNVPCSGGCSSGPCLNGGSCFESPYGYKCQCGSDFTGTFCEKAFCPRTPCKRGATCFDSHYGYKYRCLFNEIMDTGTHGDLPKDCLEIIEHPEKFTDKGDGVYKIRTWRSQTVLNVFCNMSFAQGGWTVLQRRDMNNFPVLDFDRNFSEYEYGFGNPSSEYWLGLRYASELSSFANDNYVSAEYTISDGYVWQGVAENVTLKDGPSYSVVVKDSRLPYGSSSQTFTSNRFFTYDQDSAFNCAAAEDGGWWFKDDYSYCFSNDTFREQRSQDTTHDFLSFFNLNGRLLSHPHTFYYLDINDVLKETNQTMISTLLMFKRI